MDCHSGNGKAKENRFSWLRRLLHPMGGNGSCHSGSHVDTNGLRKLAIVGNPNVGKSVLFNALTGAYVTVSNYPGTTVEVSRGKGRIGGEEFEVIDTPGMYSLLPISEEERVARSILLSEKPDVVLHVVDAKNIRRMLPLTVQLLEADLPVVLDLNIMDEAERIGMAFDVTQLEEELGLPVVPTVSTSRRGLNDLRRKILDYANGENAQVPVRCCPGISTGANN